MDGDECQEAFDKIKEYLSNPPVLVPPEPGRPLFLYLTVLGNSFGCVLGQHDVTGRRYQKLRHYLLAYTTYLITRLDPLKYIFQKPMPTRRLAKWQILLTEFDIVYVTRTAMKAQALANHLAENPVDDEYQPLNTYFPNEEVNSVEVTSEDTNSWKMFFDGVVNAKGIGIGAILISPTGQHYPATNRLRFFCTNNTVEYEACIMDMNMAINQDMEELQHVEYLSKRFKSIEFRYIPHFHYELADALATLASMLPYPGNLHIDPLEIQIRERHGYCNTVEVEPDVQPWYRDIKRFLKTKEYPDQASGDQKRTIRRNASGFFLNGEVLYKRTPDLNLLRCVDAEEARRIMYEVHTGVCGSHMNGYVLAKKILRAGYYWMTMEKDCFSFVQKCHQCQVHGDLIHAPPTELHPMSTPWPFVAWGMDVIGPIEPKASNGHRFILVAIDYFTKWVEAITLKAVTKKAMVDFVHSNIIYRFGIPATIITDNTTNLNSHLMREICEQFKITHRNSTPYRPKANGAVEAANKNIKKILRKMIQSSRQWNEKLSFGLVKMKQESHNQLTKELNLHKFKAELKVLTTMNLCGRERSTTEATIIMLSAELRFREGNFGTTDTADHGEIAQQWNYLTRSRSKFR
ncbi:uncharacterized protein [Nicotiana sylvestris]|uniref:uncharacterized protein n=1 Tax=Nicotiana sylvestris TaxID=4096 RepID=UPI00388C7A04